MPPTASNVVYLGRIPHGMYEEQIKSYFTQFGDVTRLRLSRNKKTGRSKFYAFIEFASSAVARVVAETMHNYLLQGHLLVCHVVPEEKIHPRLWVGTNRRYRVVPSVRLSKASHDRLRTDAERERAERRLLKRQDIRKKKLEEAGISYNFDAVAYQKHPLTEDE